MQRDKETGAVDKVTTEKMLKPRIGQKRERYRFYFWSKSIMFCVGSVPTSCKDYQEIKVQEQVQKLAVGTIPRSMWVVLEDDLVDVCKAGDDVTICGTVMRRWRPLSLDVSKVQICVSLRGNNVSYFGRA